MAGRDMLLRDVEIAGVGRGDLAVRDGRIDAIGIGLDSPGATVVDAAGGAVLPGLHDHHCHLLAMAAARESVDCGPPGVTTSADFLDRVRQAGPICGWVRAVGYHESVAGDLDRHVLDAVRADLPVRVQHGGGSLWVVNSCGLAALGVGGWVAGEPAGVERDGRGVATGRLWRCDGWLRERIGPRPGPDLGAVSTQLASFGVTGVTDATPDLDEAALMLLRDRSLRQRVVLLGDAGSCAPRKIVVSDHALPTVDEVAASIANNRPRAVAVHCVTRVSLVLTVAALREVGPQPGDRIEHAAVVPVELAHALAELGVTVVTQPSLPRLRGDRYLDHAEAADRPFLWPFASLVAAGVPVMCSSDAPYGSADPWFSIASAVARRTTSGREIVATESVPAELALRGYLTDPLAPGGVVRTVEVGRDADLVLLDAPLGAVLADPDASHVRLTMVGGEVIHGA